MQRIKNVSEVFSRFIVIGNAQRQKFEGQECIRTETREGLFTSLYRMISTGEVIYNVNVLALVTVI